MKYLTLVLFLLVGGMALGLERLPTGNKYQGVIYKGDYQIFPQGRVGNALYYKRKQVALHDSRTIVDVLFIPSSSLFVYLLDDTQANFEVRMRSLDPDEKPRLKRIDHEFYRIQMSNGFSKFVQVFRDKLNPIAFHINTVRGFELSKKAATFYHIAKRETVDLEDGETKEVYTLRLHVVKRGQSKVVTLPYKVMSQFFNIELSWDDENTISYSGRDLDTQFIAVREHFPNF